MAQKNQLAAVRNQAVSQKDQAEAKYRVDKESITLLKINLERTLGDFERAKKQFEGNVITAEQYEHIQKAYESARAQYDASSVQLDLSRSQINTALAGIKSSEAQIGVVESQLRNTRIVAPAKAVAAKKWLESGDVTQPGQTIVSLTLDDKCWIAVYLEETDLGAIYTDQKARFTIDAYPGKTFTGHVSYIGSTTASQFSLIPANNASGNFTKVTQRIPLKISIDGVDDGSPLEDYRMLPGMSAVVKIIRGS
jgi:membrane fusion protein (multidrug efflux system)